MARSRRSGSRRSTRRAVAARRPSRVLRRSGRTGRRVNGSRAQSLRIVVQTAPAQPAPGPMVLPGDTQLVMPGEAKPRRSRF